MLYETVIRVLIVTAKAMSQISVALFSRKCVSSLYELQLTESANISYHDLISTSKAKYIG
jgi:hypothetical protein